MRRVVITGLGIVVPSGVGCAEFWRNNNAGRSFTRYEPSMEAMGLKSHVIASLDGFRLSDHHASDVVDEVGPLSRFVQFGVTAGSMAVRDAGLPEADFTRERSGLVFSSAIGGTPEFQEMYEQQSARGTEALRRLPEGSRFYDSVFLNFTPAWLARRYRLLGPCTSLTTGCTAGIDAMGLGFDLVRFGELDVVVTGAAEAPLCGVSYATLDVIGSLASSDVPAAAASRPFDSLRSGFVLSEGAAAVVLEDWEHACRRGVRVYGEVLAYSSLNNAYHMSDLAPDGAAMAAVLRGCLADADLRPDGIDYINAHGSSTPQNDLFETRAFKSELGEHAYRVPISSTKSMIGHSLSSASLVGVVATIGAMQTGVVPPTINLDHPDLECDLDYVPNRARPHVVRTALVSASGFGGIHSCAALRRVGPVPRGYPDEFARRYRDAGYWREETLVDAVLRHAETAPDDIAVAGERPLTYRELRAQSARLAGALRRLGIGQGDVIGAQLANTPELPGLLLALMSVGAVPIMIVPALGARDVRHVMRTGSARWLMVDASSQRGATLASARTLRAQLPGLRGLLVVNAAGPLGPGPGPLGPGEVDLLALAAAEGGGDVGDLGRPDGVAIFLLSGGTTGLPKLIPRTHRDYVYNARRSAELSGLSRRSVYLAALPAAHNLTLGCPGVMGTLCSGGRVVLAPRSNAGTALALIGRERVTMTAVVPSVVLDWCAAMEASRLDVSSLEVLMVGGARLHPEQARRALAVFGCVLQQSYGMSEGFLSVTRLDDPPDIAVQTQGRPVSPADEHRLVDERGQDVLAGEVGELLVRGPYTIRGYHGAPDADRSSFTADGFYRTGDRARLHPGGSLVVTGRAGDVINRGGEKVAAVELEELLTDHPGIAACAVLGVADDHLGERVCACCVVRDGAVVDLVGLRRFLAEQGLAPYKLPERLIVVDVLPVTAIGKVDKQALRAVLTQRSQER
jgi:minimal PKS ketosynthase (KS/KS alpha)